MAEEIVSCPGCGKKFRIPEGAPAGAFQCTACNATVPYGAPARGAAPAARGAAPAARAAAAAPARSGAKAAAKGAARRAAAARHAREEEPEDEGPRGRRPKKDKANPAVVWGSVGGIALALVIVFVVLSKNRKPADVGPTVAPPPPAPVVAPTPEAGTPAAGTPAAAGGGGAGTAGTGSASGGSGDSGAPSSGIGGTSTASGAGGAAVPSNLDQLFVRIDDVPGVTPQEREAMDKDVALLIDRDSAAAGISARNRLKKLQRKAIPALLSTFESAWKGKKWDDDREKIATHEVQSLLAEIVKADRPGGDFIARYDPRVPVPPKDFEKAARMWARWWLERGKDLETFKNWPE